ncbi:TFIIH_basal transcription factor subunit [Hexamita inflata]|uniref:TFIIH basal transcription factor subunit n=1 Tax=Hexamita inflata TaxID=28002 RepID=A0AA86NX04_9EUKA|nr:TFIIH basal transcription factor subunit [Hexamita inflata]
MKAFELIRHFIVLVDASKSLKTTEIPKLISTLRYMFQSIQEHTPQSVMALAVLQSSKAYLETKFTQNIDELLCVFEGDRVTQAGSVSISSALKLINQIQVAPYQKLTAVYINFSQITFDNENIFELTAQLVKKQITFHCMSVGADIFVLNSLSSQLRGEHFLYQNLDQLNQQRRTWIEQLKHQYAYFQPEKMVKCSIGQLNLKEQLCNCCGELKIGLYKCQNCGGLNCSLTNCCLCENFLVSAQNVKKSQLSCLGQQFVGQNIELKDERKCFGCEAEAQIMCGKCGQVFCTGCEKVCQDLGVCISCQKFE